MQCTQPLFTENKFLTYATYDNVEPPDGAIYPWMKHIDLEAPEDDLIPEASSFGPSVLNFLTQSVDEERKKYLAFIDSNVDAEFLSVTNVRQLLVSYQDNFVKTEWKGLNIEPLEFEFSVDLPKRMKPHGVSIPVKLMEATKIEYERLLTYFYEPCDSPHASPLTVAPKATCRELIHTLFTVINLSHMFSTRFKNYGGSNISLT